LARQHHQLVAGVEAFNAHGAGAVGEEGRVAELAPWELFDIGALRRHGDVAGVAAAVVRVDVQEWVWSLERVRELGHRRA
tara:strand:+ start:302 stop:541 length:240 start_codon:yes stop_codon:yes gene_type:complete